MKAADQSPAPKTEPSANPEENQAPAPPSPEAEAELTAEKSETAETSSAPEATPSPAKESDEDWSHGDDEETLGEDDEDNHELDMPNYGEMPVAALVKSAEHLIGNHPPQQLREHLEAIRKHLMEQLDEEREEKLQQFIEEGGEEKDFDYPQPLRDRFRELFRLYRDERRKFYREREQQLKHNLATKQALIEQLKEIVNKEESIGETFKEFHSIQQAWNQAGPVPRNESQDLWRTYNHHRDNFYEFIKINKELRDLDYQKNRETKEALIAKAESLLESEKVMPAFKQLQDLHKQWRRVGPVERELRDSLWDRFSELTKAMHAKREQLWANQQEHKEELIAEKQALVEELRQLPLQLESHNQWQKNLKQLEDIKKRYQGVGRIPGPENDQLWEDFRAARKEITKAKNAFYKSLKAEQNANLARKRALIEEAKALQESEDWGETAKRLKKIQSDWKKIGPIPRKESDATWKEFRAACNHFFERLKNKDAARDEKRLEHLQKKEAMLAEMKDWQPDLSDKKAAVEAIKNWIGQWKSIGAVPQKEQQKVEGLFNEQIDSYFKAIDYDRAQARRIRFENKLDNLEEKGGASELKKERSFIGRKVEEAQRELAQLETNMSFFRNSDPKSPIVKEAQKKLEEQARVIAQLQEQHKMLNIKIRALAQEASSAEKEASESEPN